VGLQIRALCGKEGLQAFTIVIQLFVGVEVKKAKNGDEMGGTSCVATCHDKDVLSDRVKRDVPHLVKLHLVACRASIDKDRP
jgi:hypothetical protein